MQQRFRQCGLAGGGVTDEGDGSYRVRQILRHFEFAPDFSRLQPSIETRLARHKQLDQPHS
jgi:hypothetical protein